MLASQVSSDQAREQARKFLAEKGISGFLSPATTKSARLRSLKLEPEEYLYVFNVGNGQGYVIVSGDDSTPAVLGYSSHGSFDADQIPVNMAAWLKGYADEIRFAQSHNLPVGKRRAVSSHAAISDLLQTTWNQSVPYNDGCPVWNEKKCLAGCWSTAVAQVMKYHSYPTGMTTAIPGFTTTTHKIVCEALPATTFDWGSMGATASTEESKEAIAKLIKYCSYAMEADFTLEGTSIWDDKAQIALHDYFGYGDGILLARRDTYSEENWDRLIYTELAAGRPVIYSGQDGKTGHTFVVHGYDGNGYYSVNWGWGGLADGYFLLGAMTPPVGGAGTLGAEGKGYNTNQTALVGISPDDVTPYQVTDEVIALTTNYIHLPEGNNEYLPDADGDYEVTFYACFMNNLSNTYDFNFNIAVYKDDTIIDYLYAGEYAINGMGPMYYFPYSDGEHPDEMKVYLSDLMTTGTYKLIPVSRKKGDATWNNNFGSDEYYLTAVVTADKKVRLYVGEAGSEPDPAPSPSSELSKEQLETYGKQLDTMRNDIEDLMIKTKVLEDEIEDVNKAAQQQKQTLGVIETVLAEIISTLKTDTLLTAQQKNDFELALGELVTEDHTLSEGLEELDKSIAGYTDNIDNIKELLNFIYSDYVKLNEGRGSIATQEQLTADSTKLEEIRGGWLKAYDTLGHLSSQIEKAVGSIPTSSVSVLEKYVAELKESVSTAINTEKERAGKEKAMAPFNEVLENLKSNIATVEGYYKERLDTYQKLQEKMTEIERTIGNLEQQLLALEKMLQESSAAPTRASDEDLASLKEQLDVVKGHIDTLKSQKANLLTQMESVEQQLDILKTYITGAHDDAASAEESAKKATKAADVDAITQQLQLKAVVFSSDAISAVNTIGSNLNVIIDNQNILAHNINIVSPVITNFQAQVEAAVGTDIESMRKEADVISRFDLQGRPVDGQYKGVVIEKLKDGKTRKVYRR